VAWVDRPGPPCTAPQPIPLPYPTAAPACRVDQIQATGAAVGFATGNVDERFTFTNISRASCMLRGFPTISALAPNGRRVRLHAGRSPRGDFFGLLVPAAMPPGRHVNLDLTTEDVTCRLGRPFVYRDLTFRLPDGRRLLTHTRLPRFCGGWRMSRFGLPERTTATVPPSPGSLDTLRVSVSLPPSARAGATLRYLVTITNPTDTAVPLEPCPSYTEAMFLQTGSTEHHVSPTFFLNCDAVRLIAPGRHVRYEMRLRLPAMPSGVAKFGWHLNTPNEPGAGTVLAIRAREPGQGSIRICPVWAARLVDLARLPDGNRNVLVKEIESPIPVGLTTTTPCA
jgi:Protein of unknown function (DUF4232)